MSRVSDTRLRTREAAARLVSGGLRPDKITVDMIYAEIKQGSRTTINDELKVFKDEQARVNALTAALPAPVANSMLGVWALAIEHAQKVFDGQREELEAQVAETTAQVQALEGEKAGLARQVEGLQANLVEGQSELTVLQEMLAGERSAKEAAMVRATALEEQLTAAKADAERTVATLKAEHRRQTDELQAALAAQEAAFRQEIDKATERLESVQRHVMLQVEEARDAKIRAEAQLARASQKNEQLGGELQHAAREAALAAQRFERAHADLAQLQAEVDRGREAREALAQQLAGANGKLGALAEQNAALERRAVGAETRLEEALKRAAEEAKQREERHANEANPPPAER